VPSRSRPAPFGLNKRLSAVSVSRALGGGIGQPGNAFGNGGQIGVLIGDLPLEPGLALAGFADQPLELGAFGGSLGALGSDHAQRCFGFGKLCLRCLEGLP
jgi:hypothetical protein